MNNEGLQPSVILKLFLDLADKSKSIYSYNLEAMKNEERITQDYLHKLELEGLNYRERSKIATKLAENRKARREFKDVVEELEPIIEFFNDPVNKRILNNMTQLLGQVRKIENYHKNRIYMPKVITSEDIKSDSNLKEVS